MFSKTVKSDKKRDFKSVVTMISSVYMMVLLLFSLGERFSYTHTLWHNVIGEAIHALYLPITLKELIYIIGFPVLLLLLNCVRKTLLCIDTLCIMIYTTIIFTVSIMDIEVDVLWSIASSYFVVLPLMISYYLFRLFNDEEGKRFLHRTILASAYFWCIACVVSLFYYFINYQANYYFGNAGWSNPQGVAYGRLYGAFSDPNYAAIYCLLITVGILYLFVTEHPTGYTKVLLIISIIANVMYIVLSASRTCYAAVIVVSAAYCLYQAFEKGKNAGILGQAWRFLLRFILIMAALVAVYFLIKNLCQLIGNLTFPDRAQDEFVRVTNTGEKITAFDSDRFLIWGDYLKIWKDRPLFGFSPNGALAYAQTYYPEMYISRVGLVPHSMYIQILVQSGIIGFLSLIYVMISPCIRFIWTFFKQRNKIPPYIYLFVLWALIGFVDGFFYNCGVTQIMFASELFWISIGGIHIFTQKCYQTYKAARLMRT